MAQKKPEFRLFRKRQLGFFALCPTQGNFKSRVEQQEKSLGQRALAKAAKPLLAVLDDFARARLASDSKGSPCCILGLGFRV